MTNTLEEHIANNTVKIGKAVTKHFPHLTFAIWDLSDFLPALHNVRRNMVFIECEETARNEVIRMLASEPTLRDYLVYSGERRPIAINEAWANATSTNEIRSVIVAIARKDFRETSDFTRALNNPNIRFPFLERRLVDILTYAYREWLPFSLEEAMDALLWCLKKKEIRISELKRYASRRYMGTLLDVVLYKMGKKGLLNVAELDPRHMEAGKRFLDAIKKVDEL